jgi:hypothetical protein
METLPSYHQPQDHPQPNLLVVDSNGCHPGRGVGWDWWSGVGQTGVVDDSSGGVGSVWPLVAKKKTT